MDNWMLIAFVGAFLAACSNFVDKYILERRISDPLSMIAFIVVVAVLTIGLSWGFMGLNPLDPKTSLLLILSGVFVFSAIMLYFSVLAQDHVSFVVVFFQLLPVLIMLEGLLFFNEKLTAVQLMGSGLVIVSATALSWVDHSSTKFKWKITKKSFLKMIAFDILWAVSILCIKFASDTADFLQIVTYEQAGVLLAAVVFLIISVSARRAVLDMLRTTPISVKLIALLNEGLLVFISKACFNYAYSNGIISLVSVGESSQILFVVVMGTILGFLSPNIFKENVEKTIVIKKITYVCFMLFGIYLIS